MRWTTRRSPPRRPRHYGVVAPNFRRSCAYFGIDYESMMRREIGHVLCESHKLSANVCTSRLFGCAERPRLGTGWPNGPAILLAILPAGHQRDEQRDAAHGVVQGEVDD